jgi:adenine-specific DNA-methyltransferase
LLRDVDFRRVEATAKLDAARRSEMGQFLTPASIAEFMAGLFRERPETLRVLDAGAGVGSLSVACVSAACGWTKRPRKIEVTAYETDASLARYLVAALRECDEVCQKEGIAFEWEVSENDFIESAVSSLNETPMFSSPTKPFNCAILNPPYRKLNTDSRTRRLLRTVGIETSNLYAAFLWLATVLRLREGFCGPKKFAMDHRCSLRAPLV